MYGYIYIYRYLSFLISSSSLNFVTIFYCDIRDICLRILNGIVKLINDIYRDPRVIYNIYAEDENRKMQISVTLLVHQQSTNAYPIFYI